MGIVKWFQLITNGSLTIFIIRLRKVYFQSQQTIVQSNFSSIFLAFYDYKKGIVIR